MDIFPGYGVQSRVLPSTVESLAVSGFRQGLDDAAQNPTATTAIANAITGGIDAYNKETQALQQQRLNEQNIQANEQKLKLGEVATSPDALEAERMKQTVLKDKYAAAVREQEREAQLNGILKQGNPQRLAEIVMSGEFNDVLAKNPTLYKATVATAMPYIPEAQRDGLVKREQNKAYDNMLMRNQNKIQMEAQGIESEIVGNTELGNIITKNKDLQNPLTLATKIKRGEIEVVPQGTYTTDPSDSSGRVTFENGRPLRKDVGINPMLSEKQQSFQLYDKTTGRLVAENVTGPTKHLLERYTASQDKVSRITKSPSMEQLDSMVRSYGQERDGASQPAQEFKTAPTLPATPSQKSPEQRLGEKLGVEPTKSKEMQPMLKLAVDAIHDEVASDLQVRTREEREAAVAKREELVASLIDSSLRERFRSNTGVLSGVYNDATVKQYNDLRKRYIALTKQSNTREVMAERMDVFRQLGHFGGVFGAGLVTKEVTTPEDLYVLKNYDATASLYSQEARRIADQQLKKLSAQAGTPEHISQLAQTFSSIK